MLYITASPSIPIASTNQTSHSSTATEYGSSMWPNRSMDTFQQAGSCRSLKRCGHTLRNVWYSLQQGSSRNAGAPLLSPCIIEAPDGEEAGNGPEDVRIGSCVTSNAGPHGGA